MVGSQLLSCMFWNQRRHKTTYWADCFSWTNLSEWNWPKIWMYWRISSLWSLLAYWKMIICKENCSRILVYWEGRVKTTSALIAKKTVSCEVHRQGCLFGMFTLNVGRMCLCACVYTCLHVEGGIKLLTCCWHGILFSTALLCTCHCNVLHGLSTALSNQRFLFPPPLSHSPSRHTPCQCSKSVLNCDLQIPPCLCWLPRSALGHCTG